MKEVILRIKQFVRKKTIGEIDSIFKMRHCLLKIYIILQQINIAGEKIKGT